MNRTKVSAGLAVIVLVLAACAGAKTSTSSSGDTNSGGTPQRGGTLRLGMNTDVCNGFDPQKAYCSINWEFQRIMTRTLLSNNGLSATQGGTELHPDIAADLPEVSSDNKTWTFKLKPNVMYAPPFEDTPVKAEDFIRAFMREADPDASRGGYAPYYKEIEGFSDFGAGKADTISGLSAPDDTTLVVTLTDPVGDFGYRVGMAAISPIPANPDDPNAPLGIAEGHTKDWGRFQVATGPYMFEGSENLDFSVPVKEQVPVSGYQPNRSITLVRNPSYDESTDGLRPAYVDEIDVEIGATVEAISAKVDAGELDDGFDASHTTEQLQHYQTTPDLQDQVKITPTDTTSYLAMNVAEPPFDDINVRKAVNQVLDKEGIRRVGGGAATGDIANHIIPNGLTGDVNTDYNPYPSPDNQGDLTAAKEFMKQSKYDSNADGVCDDPLCEGVLALADQGDPVPKRVAVMQDNLKGIGITLNVKYVSFAAMYDTILDPNNHVALMPYLNWGRDYPDAYTFAPPLFAGDAITGSNVALTGATPAQLKEWGYKVSSVPDVSAEMDKCVPLTGEERTTCYAELDQYLMEEVVPWVPLRFASNIDIVSTNVSAYEEDTWADLMSLDHVALQPTAG